MDQHTVIHNDNNDLENNMVFNRNNIVFNQFHKKDFNNKPVDRAFMSSHKENKGLELNFDNYSMIQKNSLGHNNFANNSTIIKADLPNKTFDTTLPPNIYHNISESGRKPKESLCYSMRN